VGRCGRRDRHRQAESTNGTFVRSRACLLKIRGVVPEAGRMLRSDEISDELWALIEAVVPAGGHQVVRGITTG